MTEKANELARVREEIDRVDTAMRRLFAERMELAEQVVRIKASTNDDIYKPDREQVILGKRTEGMEPSLADAYRLFLKRIMTLSREYQYRRLPELTELPSSGPGDGHEKDMISPEKPLNLPVRTDSDASKCLSEAEAKGGNRCLAIRFACPDSPGALADVLTIIGDYGAQIRELRVKETSDGTEASDHQVFVSAELILPREKRDADALLLQLSKEICRL